MNRILIICLMALLTLNIAVFSQKAKTAAAPQKIDGYIFKNSGTTLLNESNVCNLDYRLLTLARNEIYARHGYIFKDKSLQNYFNNRKWYKSDAKFAGKLSDVEQKNVALISKFEVNYKKNETLYYFNLKIYNKSNFDINGDGNMDAIKYTVEKGIHGSMDTYILTINGFTIKEKEGEGGNQRLLYIVDINENDTIKEIAIQKYADSDYWHTTFYYYDGRKIINMGTTEGLCGSYKSLNKIGTVYGITRSYLLQSWNFKDEYKLTSKHLLKHISKPYYPAFEESQHRQLTVLKSISLYETPNSKKAIVKLKVGEKINFIGGDDKKWCLVKTETGKTGWFAVEKFDKVKELGIDADKVFEGLLHAD